MRKLPSFKGYTVDFRLREFRKVLPTKDGDICPDCGLKQIGDLGIEFIPFDTPFGKKLFAEMKRKTGNKFIGSWTRGMMQETSSIREAVEREFDRQAKREDDWFYAITVEGKEFFVVENGEFGYTAMLPDEY